MPQIKNTTFGIRGIIAANVEESRVIPFVLSTFTKDRHGTVLNQDNWALDNYRNNPLFAYQHNLSGGLCSDPNPDFVIGKSIRIDMDGNGPDKKLVADGQFEDANINPMAEKIFRKVLFGSLNRTSVKFLELGNGKYGEGDQAMNQVNETYYFEGQELLEWSIVNIPSNPDAGKRDMLKKMREEGYSALMYAFKDLEIGETDPEKVRKLLTEVEAQKDQIQRLSTLINDRK
jgi:hypothetical protein